VLQPSMVQLLERGQGKATASRIDLEAYLRKGTHRSNLPLLVRYGSVLTDCLCL
jgi:hypothetical protein